MLKMKITEIERETLISLYRKGLVSATVILYVDIVEKIKSLPNSKLSNKVKIISRDLGVGKQTVYRALRLLG